MSRVFYDEIIEKVCEKCKHYNKRLRVCRGELLPVEEAIMKNSEGRGLCYDVEDFIVKWSEK